MTFSRSSFASFKARTNQRCRCGCSRSCLLRWSSFLRPVFKAARSSWPLPSVSRDAHKASTCASCVLSDSLSISKAHSVAISCGAFRYVVWKSWQSLCLLVVQHAFPGFDLISTICWRTKRNEDKLIRNKTVCKDSRSSYQYFKGEIRGGLGISVVVPGAWPQWICSALRWNYVHSSNWLISNSHIS